MAASLIWTHAARRSRASPCSSDDLIVLPKPHAFTRLPLGEDAAMQSLEVCSHDEGSGADFEQCGCSENKDRETNQA